MVEWEKVKKIEPAHLGLPLCQSERPMSEPAGWVWRCTRAIRHGGTHIAHDLQRRVQAAWEPDDEKATEL